MAETGTRPRPTTQKKPNVQPLTHQTLKLTMRYTKIPSDKKMLNPKFMTSDQNMNQRKRKTSSTHFKENNNAFEYKWARALNTPHPTLHQH